MSDQSSLQEVKQHVSTAAPPPITIATHQCTNCQKTYTTTSRLRQHLKNSKTCGTSRLRCTICNEDFASQQRLHSHLESAKHRVVAQAIALQQQSGTNAGPVAANDTLSTVITTTMQPSEVATSDLDHLEQQVLSLRSTNTVENSALYNLIRQVIKDNTVAPIQTINIQANFTTHNVQHIKNVKTIVGDNNIDNSTNYITQVAKVTPESKERLFDSDALAKAIDKQINKDDHVLHGAMGNIKLFKDVCLQDPTTQMPYLYPIKSKKLGENQYGYIDVDGEKRYIDGTSLHTTYKEGLTKSKEYEQIYEKIIEDLALSSDATNAMLKHRFRTVPPEKWNSMLTSCILKIFESRKRKALLEESPHAKSAKTSPSSLEESLEAQGYVLDEEDVKDIREKAKNELLRQIEREEADNTLY